MEDKDLEAIIEESGGYWADDQFRIDARDLWEMLRRVAKFGLKNETESGE